MVVICILLWVFFWALIVRILLDWVRVPSDHPVGQLRNGLATVTDPVLRPLRQVIPPIRTGTIALDLSPLVLIIGLQIIINILC